ncbi:MAG: PQQ-binding-like beta-propeller repeat protein [Acidimicrobiia bacterium]|nr:PQQ-binding-like beta-propeller repeat protein [Acidimicrobiia bacterium]
MTDDDPHAMWRPGFTGTVVYGRPDELPHASAAPPAAPGHRGDRRRIRMAIGLAVLAALGLGGVVGYRSLAGDDGAADADPLRPRLPVDVRERWSVAIGGRAVSLVAGSSDDVVLAVDDRPNAIVALDGATGDVRWRAEVGGARLAALDVVGGVVVAVAVNGDATTTASAYRRDDGVRVWTRAVDAPTQVVIDGGQVLVSHPADDSSRRTLDVLDAATGDVRASITGDAVAWNRSVVQRRDGDRIELVDRASLRPVADIDLSTLGLADPSDVAATSTEAGVVVAVANAVHLLDAGGAVRSTIALNAPPGDATGIGLEALDESGALVAVQRGDRLVMLAATDGVLRQLWSDSALMLDWHVGARRRLVGVAAVTGSIVALPPQVVDAATGEARWDSPATLQRSSSLRLFAGDGFIAIRSPRGRGASPGAVVGYDLDRTELWRRPLGVATEAVLVDGALVTIDRRAAADAAIVTLYS